MALSATINPKTLTGGGITRHYGAFGLLKCRCFITIDLGSSRQVVGVEFWTRSMLDGTATTEMYTVTVDGGEPMGPFPAGNPANPNFTALEFAGQEVRFDVETSTGGNVGAVYVFDEVGGAWSASAMLQLEDTVGGDRLGTQVDPDE